MAYVAVSVEGGLFPADLLDRIASGDAPGQRAEDFAVDGQTPPSGRLTDEIQAAFSDARSFWDAFQRRLQHSRESVTTLTRTAWVVPFLERLGFELVYQPSAAVVGGESYFFSHRAGSEPDAPPVHVVGLDQALGVRAEHARRSPHALVQEYLNRSDALWGIVTNGRELRLLRNSARVSRPTYVDFDLAPLIEDNRYSEFVLLYRLLHRSRFPSGSADAPSCLLEKYYQLGIEEGGRVREHLRDGVEAALKELGTAFLVHPASDALRDAFRSGQLDAPRYYRQLLRLIYRMLVLLVVEERRQLFPPGAPNAHRQEIYARYYSLGRLRDRCERYFAEDRASDLWQGLLRTFELFRYDDLARQLGLAALGGELFGPNACPDLESAGCENARLLRATYHLSTFQDAKLRRRVNYAALDVEELGSVYESLLEFHPSVTGLTPGPSPTSLERGATERGATAGTLAFPSPSEWRGAGGEVLRFDLLPGSERKQTGSYYTPPDLVRVLIEQALVPVLEERLARATTGAEKEAALLARATTGAEKEAALLGLRVCDPASGSGHFLLAAARRIARELARLRTGEAEPTPEAYRAAVREVIRTCVYAVDRNPLAVDLCKVALWIEGYNAGLPLSFLDHHVTCGDSLVGVLDLACLGRPIPDEAYDAVGDDAKKAAAYYKKRNREEAKGQSSYEGRAADPVGSADYADDFALLAALDDRTAKDVQAKADLYAALRGGPVWYRTKVAADVWTAAFFLPLAVTLSPPSPLPSDGSGEPAVGAEPPSPARGRGDGGEGLLPVPTTDVVRQVLAGSNATDNRAVAAAVALSETHPFFHWRLEFPEVFRDGGFDVVLGNPPWERIKLQEQEFFAGRDAAIVGAPKADARKALIASLPTRNPALAAEFAVAKHEAEAESKFIRSSGRFPLCGRGDINTYSVFAETMRSVLGPRGRAGVIVPTGIATDDTNKYFFQSIVDSRALVSLYDFENREAVFPGIHRSYKFCLLTLAGGGPSPPAPLPRAGEGSPRSGRGEGAEFAFFLLRVDDLRDPERRFVLTSSDLALLNPNTHTCPIFRTRRDAELTKAIYRRVPVLIREGTPDGNPWGVRLMTMFHMSNDSHLFRTREQLQAEGWRLAGNVFERGGERYLPLYEAKLLHQFDHRWATYNGDDVRDLTPAEKDDPNCVVMPRYWAQCAEVDTRFGGRRAPEWLLASRMIAPATNERTWIANPCPRAGVGNSAAI